MKVLEHACSMNPASSNRPARPAGTAPAGSAPDSPDGAAARILLVGNPNVGKSVIFGHLTGSYATVSNYPGTTVELTQAGAPNLPGQPLVIDTPGTNSFTPLSEDERVARDTLLDWPDCRVVQVGDAKNLRRALLLSIELAELGIPFTLVLNMRDEADQAGIQIDTHRLSELLGVPVILTVATRGEGLDRLPHAIHAARRASIPFPINGELGAVLCEATAFLPAHLPGRRGLAAMLLCGDRELERRMVKIVGPEPLADIENLRRTLTSGTARTVAARFTRGRLRVADRIIAETCRTVRRRPSRLQWLNGLTTHPVWGVPIVAAVLWLTYQVVGVFGAGTAVDFMESTVFGKWVNPFAVKAAAAIPWALLRDLLVGEYGVITMALTYAVAIVLPIVFFFFVIFGLLEDSGYLPRLAVMLNRIMKTMGLNGRAVLPMVLGLGCDTMATLTARILETKKEKTLVTLLLALGVPCSAQLAVIMALTSRLSPAAILIWGAVVLLTLFAVGWIAARVIPGADSDFVLELPPLRIPRLTNILTKTLARLEWYLKEAVPLFILGTLLLFVMERLGALTVIEKAAAPVVVHLLSLPPEAASAFVVGFLRRDYGAVFLADAAKTGVLTGVQITVALVTLTLFVPCVANYFIMIRERGLKTASAMVAFILPFAFAVGGLVNWGLHLFGVTL